MMIANTCATSTYSDQRFGGEAVAEATISLELRAGLSPEETDRRIARAVRAGDVGARVLAFYLADLADRRAYQALGFKSITFYAERRFHMQPVTTREYVAVGRALQDLPEIDDAFCDGRLLYSQVREIVRVATPETECEWVKFAEGRSARELAAAVRIRARGERPTDPARRRIHNSSFKFEARMDAVEWELLNTARAKLEAETGEPVSDADMLREVVRILLSTRPDGTVPGRTPVNDSHYRPVVVHEKDSGRTVLHAADGPVELGPREAARVLRVAGRDDLAAEVEENTGPEVPPELRDEPTTDALRREILARDHFRCLCCGDKYNLTIHHKLWRRYGGRTERANLLTLCEDCHSLTHDRLIIIRGTIPGGLRFLDSHGRELDGRPAIDGLLLSRREGEQGAAPASVSLTDARAAVRLTDARAAVSLTNARAAAGPRLSDMVGQERVVNRLRRAVAAAAVQGAAVPHILLNGPPGLGKTTFARAVAAEAGTEFHRVAAPVLKETEALVQLLTSLRARDVLFIDEIHRLPPAVAETLFEAMAEGTLSLPAHVQLAPFTLIGATTEEDLLPEALRSRFQIREQLEFYRPEDLSTLLHRAASDTGLEIEPHAARTLAAAARETPREALTLVRAARDELALAGGTTIDSACARAVLAALGIDAAGLLPMERRYLKILARAGRPLGLATLAARLGVSPGTVETVWEPYLLRRELIQKTPYGRALS